MSDELSVPPRKPDSTHQDNYTGEQLKIRQPEVYGGIVKLLTLGCTKEHIAESLGCAWKTVKAVELACFPDVASARETLVRKAVHAAFQTLESVQKNAEAGKGTALDFKFLVEAAQTLSGEASQIVQHNHEWPQLNDFEKGQIKPVIDV